MNTPALLPETQAPPRRASSPAPASWLSYPGWAIAWLWSFGIGAVFCQTFLTGLIVLGWFGRWMRGRVLRSLWKASPRRDELTLHEACEELGERLPGRPHWFLRDGSSEKPATRSFFTMLLWPVWSLGVNLRLGVKLALGTWLTLGWACALLFFGWEYGWEVSFNKVYERSFVGVSTTFLGITLFAILLPYVLLAQVHVAVTGELKAMLDHRLLRRMICVSLWPLLILAGLLLGAATVFEGLKVGSRLAAGNQLGSEPTAAEIRHLGEFLRIFYFWSAIGLMVTLVVLKAITVWMYRRALVHLLKSGEVRASDLAPTLAGWVTALRIGQPITPPVQNRLWSVSSFFGRGVLRFGLFLVLFLFTLRAHVGTFLTYDPGLASSFLNQPLVQVPWFNFVPGNLEELAKAVESPDDESP